jgi:aminoglycoside phosphotransferase (APT) family kinase protein
LKIIAVLDWELSTLGNPFSDLASFCLLYHISSNKILQGLGNYDKEFSGIPTEFQLRELYINKIADVSDISEEAWNFFLSFSLFKGAAIA